MSLQREQMMASGAELLIATLEDTIHSLLKEKLALQTELELLKAGIPPHVLHHQHQQQASTSPASDLQQLSTLLEQPLNNSSSSSPYRSTAAALAVANGSLASFLELQQLVQHLQQENVCVKASLAELLQADDQEIARLHALLADKTASGTDIAKSRLGTSGTASADGLGRIVPRQQAGGRAQAADPAPAAATVVGGEVPLLFDLRRLDNADVPPVATAAAAGSTPLDPAAATVVAAAADTNAEVHMSQRQALQLQADKRPNSSIRNEGPVFSSSNSNYTRLSLHALLHHQQLMLSQLQHICKQQQQQQGEQHAGAGQSLASLFHAAQQKAAALSCVLNDIRHAVAMTPAAAFAVVDPAAAEQQPYPQQQQQQRQQLAQPLQYAEVLQTAAPAQNLEVGMPGGLGAVAPAPAVLAAAGGGGVMAAAAGSAGLAAGPTAAVPVAEAEVDTIDLRHLQQQQQQQHTTQQQQQQGQQQQEHEQQEQHSRQHLQRQHEQQQHEGGQQQQQEQEQQPQQLQAEQQQDYQQQQGYDSDELMGLLEDAYPLSPVQQSPPPAAAAPAAAAATPAAGAQLDAAGNLVSPAAAATAAAAIAAVQQQRGPSDAQQQQQQYCALCGEQFPTAAAFWVHCVMPHHVLLLLVRQQQINGVGLLGLHELRGWWRRPLLLQGGSSSLTCCQQQLGTELEFIEHCLSANHLGNVAAHLAAAEQPGSSSSRFTPDCCSHIKQLATALMEVLVAAMTIVHVLPPTAASQPLSAGKSKRARLQKLAESYETAAKSYLESFESLQQLGLLPVPVPEGAAQALHLLLTCYRQQLDAYLTGNVTYDTERSTTGNVTKVTNLQVVYELPKLDPAKKVWMNPGVYVLPVELLLLLEHEPAAAAAASVMLGMPQHQQQQRQSDQQANNKGQGMPQHLQQQQQQQGSSVEKALSGTSKHSQKGRSRQTAAATGSADQREVRRSKRQAEQPDTATNNAQAEAAAGSGAAAAALAAAAAAAATAGPVTKKRRKHEPIPRPSQLQIPSAAATAADGGSSRGASPAAAAAAVGTSGKQHSGGGGGGGGGFVQRGNVIKSPMQQTARSTSPNPHWQQQHQGSGSSKLPPWGPGLTRDPGFVSPGALEPLANFPLMPPGGFVPQGPLGDLGFGQLESSMLLPATLEGPGWGLMHVPLQQYGDLYEEQAVDLDGYPPQEGYLPDVGQPRRGRGGRHGGGRGAGRHHHHHHGHRGRGRW